ncbi:MAG: TatD family hydrolase [Spirochaetota bacterium]
MKLVDVHCHLNSSHFRDNLDSIIDDATHAGIVAMITNAITPDGWEESALLTERFDCVYCAPGIHPWYISEKDITRIHDIPSFITGKTVAIGETGLDKKIESPGFALQQSVFEDQVIMARELDLPLIIHCRGAFSELIQSFKRTGISDAGGVIHSYSGNVEVAKQLIPYGMSFSMGGAVTHRNSTKKAKVLEYIYPHYLVLETDSPDIPPVEKGDSINVPANIRYTLTAVSEILGIAEDEIAHTTTINAQKIFGLPI